MLLFRLVCGTPRVGLIPGVTNHQEVPVRAIKEGAQRGNTSTRRVERAKKTRRGIVTINTQLICYYLYLYNSGHKTFITSPTINKTAITSQIKSQTVKIG